MAVFGTADFDDHEEVHFVRDAASGLRSIIAVHNTRLGPSLGGCRMYPYTSEADAIRDVLRLARGMSYKAAAAGIALGGGKSVIIGNPRRDKTEALLRAFGRAVARLNGRYIVGEDIGTNPADMRVIRTECQAVSCLDPEDGGYGDPAPLTALGVVQAMRAGLSVVRGTSELSGVCIAVQGVGNVGFNLCKLLKTAGARLLFCEPDEANAMRAQQVGAQRVHERDIYDVEADIFAPCAIGAVLDARSIPRLKASIVAGAANNQLAQPHHADALSDRGIVYLPDYVANAGGLISCAAEWYRTERAMVRDQVLAIYETCVKILQRASEQALTPSAAADDLVQRRLEAAGSRAAFPAAGGRS